MDAYDGISQRDDVEYGGYICSCQDSIGPFSPVYYYTVVRGEVGWLPNASIATVECPSHHGAVAAWHTHGRAGTGPNQTYEDFSPEDISISDGTGLPEFLGTPTQAIRMYDPSTGTVTVIR